MKKGLFHLVFLMSLTTVANAGPPLTQPPNSSPTQPPNQSQGPTQGPTQTPIKSPTQTQGPTRTPIPPTQTPMPPSLSVSIKSGQTDDNVQTNFDYMIKNIGSSTVSGISVRIYFKLDGGVNDACSNYVLEKHYDTTNMATISAPTSMNSSVCYFTINYGVNSSLAAGQQWEFHAGLHRLDWASTYDGGNDWYHTGYAVGSLPAAFTPTIYIPVYVNGTLVAGSLPPQNTPIPTP